MSFVDDSDGNVVRWKITDRHPVEQIIAYYGLWNTRNIHHMSYIRNTKCNTQDERKLQESRPEQIMFVSGDYDAA